MATVKSGVVQITVGSYTLTLQSDKNIVAVGEQLTLSGLLTFSGVAVANKTINLIIDNVQQAQTAQTDNQGNYGFNLVFAQGSDGVHNIETSFTY